MGKVVFIAEKPSVAQDFARALHLNFTKRDGYQEAENTIVTWCFGHLVTMSYPDAYDPKYKKWSLDTIPFVPETYQYHVIDDPGTRKQFGIVKRILTSPEVDTIYICTDSGREGEYIYRLVANMAGVRGKRQLRVWIDSFTDDEIRRGIREARDDAEYDNMGAAAYLRAKEDYLMGINFSRALSLKYARGIAGFLGMDHCVIAVGRVMTCVLGIVVRREREIRAFVKTPFYRVVGTFGKGEGAETATFTAEWSAGKGSVYEESPRLYKENGFKERIDAEALIAYLGGGTLPAGTAIPGQSYQPGDVIPAGEAVVKSISHKKETRNAPLLYNLAELQNDCSRLFKISPDQTLDAAQTLYERKLTTYPRTDARVLSTAAAKEIDKNLKGIGSLPMYRELVRPIAESGSWKKIGKSRYTNDSAITDHYAIIPTGQGFNAIQSLSPTHQKVYELIVRRFLAIFYPAAVFDKMTVQVGIKTELLQAGVRVNKERGYLDVMEYSWSRQAGGRTPSTDENTDTGENGSGDNVDAAALEERLKSLKKGDILRMESLAVKEGETTPPKRYNSGSMILTMENAGQFIEDETLREQIRGAGIGTSATRAGILEKLVNNQYLNLNSKTQIYTPTQLGEMIYDTVDCSLRPMLDPRLTASWEKGLSQVAEGTTTEAEYTAKLNDYIVRRTELVKASNNESMLQELYRRDAQYYSKPMHFKSKYSYGKTRKSGGSRKGTASTRKSNKTNTEES